MPAFNLYKFILDLNSFFGMINKDRNGGCRQAVKASDCGSDMRGFESHLPPHYILRPH